MKDFISKAIGTREAPQRAEGDVRVAACALFLEMANIDNEFSEEERQHILGILHSEFGLSEDDALELAQEAAAELEGSIDLWRFTNMINKNYSEAEKIRVVELLWQVVYADGHVDAHEDYLVHKVTKLLRLPHKQMIAAKLRVLHSDENDAS
ncbi:MAG: TerB family tellurite resistance protein [Candidatus Krumholzibacteriota bacterium]|nr:TerB family tellurite resistance protein [Candidatus Krumholzibacteriota bacterium]